MFPIWLVSSQVPLWDQAEYLEAARAASITVEMVGLAGLRLIKSLWARLLDGNRTHRFS